MNAFSVFLTDSLNKCVHLTALVFVDERAAISPCFFFQVEEILRNEPEVKEKLFAVLKQFAAERKVDWLASVLPDILTTEEQQQLISNIRYPPKLHLPLTALINF